MRESNRGSMFIVGLGLVIILMGIFVVVRRQRLQRVSSVIRTNVNERQQLRNMAPLPQEGTASDYTALPADSAVVPEVANATITELDTSMQAVDNNVIKDDLTDL